MDFNDEKPIKKKRSKYMQAFAPSEVSSQKTFDHQPSLPSLLSNSVIAKKKSEVYELSQNSSHVSADVSFGELVSKIEKDLMESTVMGR